MKNIRIFLEKLFSWCPVRRKISPKINIFDNGIPECPICMEEASNKSIMFLECNHWACARCVRRMILFRKGRLECHMCRQKYDDGIKSIIYVK